MSVATIPVDLHLAPIATRAVLASAGALGGIATALLLLVSIGVDAGAEADRSAGARTDAYASTLVGALAGNLWSPLR